MQTNLGPQPYWMNVQVFGYGLKGRLNYSQHPTPTTILPPPHSRKPNHLRQKEGC